ncbi:HAD family hydrolase [Ornithinimicrobium cavernae]|uniref:HAD family hydrolase n=1 Tax=Ornithinimicrobium cavernae TaxID=2666047 RepID=UPI000D68B605|nr:HAD-IA family hydrolase [Ornithinimicrobium cavernae]
MQWDNYDAALFDLDGVLTPTAEVHMSAWARMFTDFLTARGVSEPYTEDDYFAHIDGRPRYEGVAALLESRGIELPEGSAEDPPTAETVCGLGNRKNELFTEVLRSDGIQAYAGSLALLDHLEQVGVRMAVVSSSRNAPEVLEAAGIADRFPVVVHGGVAQEQQLAGKPRPDTYAYAAEQLGVPTSRSVVLEDAISGVQAGAAGDFGLVVGVDRGAGAEPLRENGAEVVVQDLAELIGERS